jgi:hypothetical protein
MTIENVFEQARQKIDAGHCPVCSERLVPGALVPFAKVQDAGKHAIAFRCPTDMEHIESSEWPTFFYEKAKVRS